MQHFYTNVVFNSYTKISLIKFLFLIKSVLTKEWFSISRLIFSLCSFIVIFPTPTPTPIPLPPTGFDYINFGVWNIYNKNPCLVNNTKSAIWKRTLTIRETFSVFMKIVILSLLFTGRIKKSDPPNAPYEK